MSGGTVASTNPTISPQGSITKGAVDPSTGATAVLKDGTLGRGSFLVLADTASLIGKIAFQVPASMLAMAAPSAAQQQAAIQAATSIAQEANNSRMMAGMLGQALGALGPALAGMFNGMGDGAGRGRARTSVASADGSNGGDCANGQCGNRAAQEVAWNDQGAGPCANGQCGNS